jgi:hypothetical protein
MPSPTKIQEDMWAAWRSLALAAALKLDLFTHIDAGNATVAELAGAIGADARAVERLAEAMAALGYLRRRGDSLQLTPVAKTYLVRGGEFYMEGLAAVAIQQSEAWLRLDEVVRSGKPLQTSADRVQFFRALVKTIFPWSYVPSQAVVAALSRPARARIRNIFDVAAGSAAWSLAFARALPAARVTALDLPPVLEVTREFVTRFNLADRYDYIAGDLNEIDFGKERYDLVILGQILHGQDREGARRLIEKSAAALRAKGMILIAEYVPNDQRVGPPPAVLFGLNMLLNTPGGDVYTMRDYREWLKAAGMKSVKTIPAPIISAPILAVK